MTSAPLHIAASLVVTLGFAALSWHFIEEPALRLKERLRGRGKVVPIAAIQPDSVRPEEA